VRAARVPYGILAAMPEESTTPDLVELTRRVFDAADRGDFEAIMSFFDSEAVYDVSPMGLGVYEGATAIRHFFEEWRGSYVEYDTKPKEVLEPGEGVTFGVVIQRGRPAGSDGQVRIEYAVVLTWAEGLIPRVTNYTDIGEARAAAERLAESRG
jgi:ketosteroid isomerase-like protein